MEAVPTATKANPATLREVHFAKEWLDIRQGACCGICEVSGLSAYGDHKVGTLFTHLSLQYVYNGACIIFTDATKGCYDSEEENPEADDWPSYATGLADYIRDNGLGTVTRSEPMFNKNSEHFIRVYTWHYDLPRVFAHFRQIAPDLKNYFNGFHPE